MIISHTDKKMKCQVCLKGEITHQVLIFDMKSGDREKEIFCCEECKDNINFRKYE